MTGLIRIIHALVRRLPFVLALGLAATLAAAAPSLLGTWSGTADGEPLSVTFSAGGQGRSNGAPLRWELQGNVLYVEQEGEVAVYQVQIGTDRLVVTGGPFLEPVTLTRGAAAAGKAAPAAPAAKATGGSSAGGGRELVGKWCKGGSFSANAGGGSSSMTCFELKADGSYTYQHEGSLSAYAPGAWGGTSSQSSDAGRWSVAGNRLTARSQGGQVNTYTLEKRNHPKNRDPMICLDGDCYTTYWQKPAW